MRLREIMRKRVETISPRESGAGALERMRRGRFHHLVVQDGSKIVGVLSDRDVASMGALGQVETVAEIMSAPVVTATPDMTVRQVANLLRGRKVGCLPVLEEGRVAGIVTTTDILDLVGEGKERPVAKTRRWILKDRGPRGKRVAKRVSS